MDDSRHIRPSSLLRINDDSIRISIEHHLHNAFPIRDLGEPGGPDDPDGPARMYLKKRQARCDAGPGGHKNEGFELLEFRSALLTYTYIGWRRGYKP